MKQRCQNEKCYAFHNYGARGIKVCDDWQEFELFCDWALNNGYEKGLDLDRINNDGNYEPENCRWTTRQENINNRRTNAIINVNGISKTIAEWERYANIHQGAIGYWMKMHGEEYAAERIKEAMLYGYKEKDFSRNHVTKAVRCIETGEIFPSIKEASRQLGVNSGNIVRAYRTGTKTGGYTFEVID